MKYLLLIFGLFVFNSSLLAQNAPQEPPYLRFPTVPPFQLLALDSTGTITKADLKKNHPVMIIYFNTDCDHCHQQTQDLLKNMDKLKNVQIVLASYEPLHIISAYADKNEFTKYPNILIGRDTKYFLPPFYNVAFTPFVAIYDKKGNLVKGNEGNLKPNVFLKLLKEQ